MAQEMVVNRSSGGEKNGIVYNMFCIIIIIIFVNITSSSISIYFVDY